MGRAPSAALVVLCLALIAGLAPPATVAAAPPAQAGSYYIVRPGDTLSGIARRFGYSFYQLASANRISNPNRIYVGQRIYLPPYGSRPGAPGNYYVVQRGDTLSGIAARYGTTVASLMAANGLRSTTIYVGQRLLVRFGGGGDYPVPPGRWATYCVRAGDTLSGIAARYRTTVGAIMRWNNLRSTTIYVGQCLRIDP